MQENVSPTIRDEWPITQASSHTFFFNFGTNRKYIAIIPELGCAKNGELCIHSYTHPYMHHVQKHIKMLRQRTILVVFSQTKKGTSFSILQ